MFLLIIKSGLTGLHKKLLKSSQLKKNGLKNLLIYNGFFFKLQNENDKNDI